MYTIKNKTSREAKLKWIRIQSTVSLQPFTTKITELMNESDFFGFDCACNHSLHASVRSEIKRTLDRNQSVQILKNSKESFVNQIHGLQFEQDRDHEEISDKATGVND